MEFIHIDQPRIEKPIMVAAMQDMGNVGSIVVNFINGKLRTKKFRVVRQSYPSYVVDTGGYVDMPNESWEYRHTDGMIVFGGGYGQPQGNADLNSICQDVIDVARRYSAKFIYTLGGFHTNRVLQKMPRTYVTTTSAQLTRQMQELGVETTPHRSVITGFNGLILGFAKQNGIYGIGMYGELNNPEIPQYRAAISIIKTLEKLTYRKIGSTDSLESMAQEVERDFEN